MARRSDHSKEEIKALAIKHAYKLIEENGEAGFKARDIAKRMGYTVGTIYYVFGNMENLRLPCLRSYFGPSSHSLRL